MPPALVAFAAASFLMSTPLKPAPRTVELYRESAARRFALPAAERTVVQQQVVAPTLPRNTPGHSLFAAAIRWGMLQSSDVDDVMLALVSPEAFWLLRAWQKRMYGDQRQRASALKAARHQLRNGVLSPTLTRQIAFVTVRGKSLWSTFHKAAVRKREVHDVLALRVVVRGDEEDCMKVLSSIREVWPSIDGRFKNYVDTPKRNGYQALHDTVLLPGGQPMEIQIRTDEMHARAEFGTAAHRRYKGALFWMPRTMLAGVIAAPAMASSGTKSSLPRWSL